jgi:hypothetical protein
MTTVVLTAPDSMPAVTAWMCISLHCTCTLLRVMIIEPLRVLITYIRACILASIMLLLFVLLRTQSTTAKPSAEACNSRHTNHTEAAEGRPWHAEYVPTSYDW